MKLTDVYIATIELHSDCEVIGVFSTEKIGLEGTKLYIEDNLLSEDDESKVRITKREIDETV